MYSIYAAVRAGGCQYEQENISFKISQMSKLCLHMYNCNTSIWGGLFFKFQGSLEARTFVRMYKQLWSFTIHNIKFILRIV